MSKKKVIRELVDKPFEGSPKSYMRAATQRAEAAKALLDIPGARDFGLDAIYLAGYTVECCLKALILERTPTKKRKKALEEISSGSTCHNYDFLLRELKLKGVTVPPPIRESLESTKKEWNTRLRYHGTRVPYNEASEFFENAWRVFTWVEGRGV